MDNIYGDSKYVSNSIGISRKFQENFSAASGITAYGKIASLISSNAEHIDRMAEYLGTFFAQNDINRRYTKQYGKSNIFGGIKRKFTSPDKAWVNQTERRDQGFLKGLAVEGGIKLLSRGIQQWTSNKEKYNCFDQIYRILLAYVNEDRQRIAGDNLQLEIKELNKIRNSFPLSAKDRLKLSGISVENLDIFTSDFSIFKLEGSNKIKENISYFLYVLYAQKYGDSVENESRLLQYYRFLGFHDMESRELLRENKNIYDTVTDDQLKYLMLSRAMLRKLEPSIPYISINAMKLRIDEMAKNDPYRIRKKIVIKPSLKSPKTIIDLFFEEPDIVIQAGSIAMSQLEMSDDTKENVRKTMVNDWGFDDEAHKNIMLESSDIQKESTDVEYCF